MFIRRVDETGSTLLPRVYDSRAQTEEAIQRIVREFEKYGPNDEHGYWWARDGQGPVIKFFPA